MLAMLYGYMTIIELKGCIDQAIDNCQKMIIANSNIVLSEGDFEKLLCCCISEVIKENKISPGKDDFSVHTQLSHYIDGKKHRDICPDIIILKESLVKELTETDKPQPNKDYLYRGPSIAIELKHIHGKESISIVNHDFDKWKNKLNNNTYLFVNVLIDILPNSRKNTFEKRKSKVIQIFERMKKEYGYEQYLFCNILKRIKENKDKKKK